MGCSPLQDNGSDDSFHVSIAIQTASADDVKQSLRTRPLSSDRSTSPSSSHGTVISKTEEADMLPMHINVSPYFIPSDLRPPPGLPPPNVAGAPEEKPVDGGRTPLSSKATVFVPGKGGPQADVGPSGQAAAEARAMPPETDLGNRPTTVMMRNVPNSYTRDELVLLLDRLGFAHRYDFVYLPVDFASMSNVGYAFVNLIDPEWAVRFMKFFNGFDQWTCSQSRKVCVVCWGEVQGLRSNIARFKRNPVMRKQVMDQCKPALFSNGRQIPFPDFAKEQHRSRLFRKGTC